jgi:predicted RNA-binding Zn-ribbon protein involved in translation (DUF1610 family)
MASITVKRIPLRTCPRIESNPSIAQLPQIEDSELLTLSSFGLQQPQVQEEDKPITGTYTNDYNIIEVHRKILRILSPDGPRVTKLRLKKDSLQKRLDKPQTMIERKRLLASIQDLTNKITELTSSKLLNEYNEQVSPYIKMYAQLGRGERVISLAKPAEVAKNNILSSKPEEPSDRLAIIAQYLNIASRYVEINVMRETSYNPYCSCCGFNLADLEAQETSVTYCPRCGLECNLVNQFVNSLSGDKNSKDSYEDRVNMIKAMKRFQGKQTNKIPKDLLTKLDDHFRSYSLPISEEIKKRPLDSRGKREGTSLDMLLKALADVGYSSYYEDANLIGHLYWGWELPDIGYLEESIMKDYDESQRIFDRIKGDRKSCLNTQYRLFRHLQKLGYPCSKKDFKIVSTREILEYHEEAWSTICKELGWPFYPII